MFLFEQLSSVGNTPPPEMARLRSQIRYTRDDLKALTMPVLFIVGSEDRIVRPDAIREAASLCPNSRVEEIAGAGHSPYFEKPEPWNTVLLRFLGSAGIGRT